MVAKDKEGKNALVPGLLLTNLEEVRRFQDCLKQIALKKEINSQNNNFDFESIMDSKLYNVKVDM